MSRGGVSVRVLHRVGAGRGAHLADALQLRGGMSGDVRQVLGKSGEDLACDELKRRGYAILARRYRTRLGELDIVARDGETLVFVEVKARRTGRFGRPEDAVTWRKRQRMQRLAGDFLARTRLSDVPCRFDVVAVTMGAAPGAGQVEVFPGAFDAMG